MRKINQTFFKQTDNHSIFFDLHFPYTHQIHFITVTHYYDDEYNIAESSLVQSSRKLFLLLVCNLVIGLLLSRSSNCMLNDNESCSNRSSSSINKKTSSGNISSINNQSASLIGLDDPLSSSFSLYQVGMETQDIGEKAKGTKEYGNINDNSSATVLKQFKSYSWWW